MFTVNVLIFNTFYLNQLLYNVYAIVILLSHVNGRNS